MPQSAAPFAPDRGFGIHARTLALRLRAYHVVFNTPGDQIHALVSGYAAALRALGDGAPPDLGVIRGLVGGAFTRGHFARAV